MIPFRLWFFLQENFDPAAYDGLFNQELDAVLPSIRDPDERSRLTALRGGWTNYIAACLRNAGFRDQRDLEEKIHDVVVKLLFSPGGLFRDYDQQRHGPLDRRFKRSAANAAVNIAEKERNRRKFLNPVPGTEFGNARVEDLPARRVPNHDPMLIDRFRMLLQSRLGDLAVAIFDARLDGRETKSLIGLPELNRPGRYVVKRTVRQIKNLAGDFARASDYPDFLRRVERLIDADVATAARRLATMRSNNRSSVSGAVDTPKKTN